MAANRISHLASPLSHAPAPKSHPQPPLANVPPGFVVCPPHVALANSWQAEIYRLAYERAQAQTQLPRFHRLLFSVWN
jgi:hypothetical protein